MTPLNTMNPQVRRWPDRRPTSSMAAAFSGSVAFAGRAPGTAGEAIQANDARSTLPAANYRSAVALADAHSRDGVSLGELWRSLLSGRVKLTDSFCDEQRYFLTFRRGKVSARGLSARRASYLERCLLGEQRKLVAADIRLSQSTIAAGMAECLREMGLDVAGSRVPMLLVVAAHASRGEGSIRTARLSDVPGKAEQVVSIPRPDSALESRLTAAEFGVIRLLAEGQNHTEMARQRGTSVRTIANQLASVFHKLGVSGRSELLHYIVLAYDSSAHEPQAEQSPLIPGQWLPVRPCTDLWTVFQPQRTGWPCAVKVKELPQAAARQAPRRS